MNVATSDETQGQEKKPDSKDFVEHLRTVHFTLVTVCLALVVILQFPSPVSIREAIRQLNTIDDSMHIWSHTWVADEALQQLKNEAGFNHCVNPVAGDSMVNILGIGMPIHFPKANWTLRISNPIQINNGLTDNIEIRRTSVDVPKRLEDFKNLWDNSYFIACPTLLADEAYNQFSTERVPLVKLTAPMLSPESGRPALLMDAGIGRKIDGLKQKQNPNSEGLLYDLRLSPPDLLAIPVLDSEVFPFDYRGLLIKELPQYHWLHSDFKHAFYELDQATTGFQDLDFEHIQRILQQNEKNSKETFQAFGVTFPIETTTRWGALLIVALQLYLWLHLSEFRRRDFASSDIAWIGAYQTPWPRAIFCLTGLIIPVGVVIFLGIRNFVSDVQWYYALYFEVAIIVSALLAGSSARDYLFHGRAIETLNNGIL